MHALEFLAVLRKRWLYVVVPTVLGVIGAAALSLSATPMYQATASVYFSINFGSTANDLFQGSNYTQKQLASYATLATLPVVLEPVIKKLGLPTTVSQLAGSVRAIASNDTVLIAIGVTDASPDEAALTANSVADQLSVVVKDLAPKGADGSPAVEVSTVARATPPTAKSSPTTTRNVAAGGLGGLFLGVLLAIARDRLDTRVRSNKDLPPSISVLSTISFDRAASKSPLLLDSHSRSSRAEAFRQLRTNLQFVDIGRPARVIVVTSSVASEGKSTTATNLAMMFGESGLRVVLIEADLRRPKVSDYLGMERTVGLVNVLAGQVSLSNALQPGGLGLTVLTSGPVPPNPSELLGSKNMASLMTLLRRRFDVVVIDTPPLLPVTDAAVAAVQADGVLLVVRYGRTTRHQIGSAVKSLEAVDARVLGAVINMAPRKGADSRNRYDGYGYYEDQSKLPKETQSDGHQIAREGDQRDRIKIDMAPIKVVDNPQHAGVEFIDTHAEARDGISAAIEHQQDASATLVPDRINGAIPRASRMRLRPGK